MPSFARQRQARNFAARGPSARSNVHFASLTRLLFVLMLLTATSGLDWSNCGGSKITFDAISLEPTPVKFGSKAAISGKFHVTSPIRSLTAESELEKKIFGLFWKSTLKDCPNHFGTCHLDFCAVLGENSALCDKGLPCGCPIEAKSYEFDTSMEIPKNDLGNIATGTFYYKVSFEEEGEQVGCLEIYFGMKRRRIF